MINMLIVNILNKFPSLKSPNLPGMSRVNVAGLTVG